MGTAILTSRSGAAGGSSGGFEVGDVLTTTRTDLGDDWLLCNGALVDIRSYPDFAKSLPMSDILNGRTIPELAKSYSSTTRDTLECAYAYDENTIIFGGADVSKYPSIWVCSKYIKDTKYIKLDTNVGYVVSICHYNGRWVAIVTSDGSYSVNSDSVSVKVYTTTDINGSWSSYYIAQYNTYQNAGYIGCYNGNWKLFMTLRTGPTVFETADPTAAANWTSTSLLSASSSMYSFGYRSTKCVDGTWVSALNRPNGSTVHVFTKKSTESNWNDITIDVSSSGDRIGILYVDGIWVLQTQYAIHTSSDLKTWTKVYTIPSQYCTSIEVSDKAFVIIPYQILGSNPTKLLLIDSPKTLNVTEISVKNSLDTAVNSNYQWAVCCIDGCVYFGSRYNGYTNYYDYYGRTLPSISSSNNAYNYIKAK